MPETNFTQGKGWPLYKAQEKKQKAAPNQGATGLPRFEQGSLASLKQSHRRQEAAARFSRAGTGLAKNYTKKRNSFAIQY